MNTALRSMTRSTLIFTVAATLFAGPMLAYADIPSKSFYIGVFGGGNIVLDDWDLHDRADSGQSPSSGAAFGLRVGGHVAPWLALELGLTALPYTSDDDDSNLALSYSGDLLFHLTRGNWVPFIDVGGGAYQNLSGDHGSDTDYHLHYGIGIRGMLTDWLALRVVARHMLTDGFEDEPFIANNLEITAGLDFFAWRESHEEPVRDTDGDGIHDPADACPTIPGAASANGCPDADGDGIVDSADRCPRAPGPVARHGCPDRDGDGVLDGADACPDTPGTQALRGCPDGDGDNVADSQDRCPTIAGTTRYAGCPDRDGDTVPDIDDRCPTEPGVPEAQGCVPQQVLDTFKGMLQGIKFRTARSTIRSSSFRVLDEAVAVLGKYPSLHIRIEGHTDDRGRDDKNMALSQARAEAVRQYLIEHGVAANRLTAKGFGETKPAADNGTRAGRAQNRRTEFVIVSH